LYGRLLYKAWGEQRWSSGTTPTTYRYTGQRSESSLGLYYYGARWYDPNLSRWLQPDSIVPLAVQGVQAWDRYAYVNNNPIKYNDPTGHDVGCGGRNADCSPYSNTSDKDRQDYLFSLMFLGSGEDGVWTRSDWEYYYGHKSELWNDPSKWINPDAETGWDLFALQTERLASHYDSSEMDQFVQDFSLVFGGISQEESWTGAAWDARHGPTLPFLNEGNDGLASAYIDTLNGPTANQSHHFTGLFYLGYNAGFGAAAAVNYARDPDNPGDIYLGTAAAYYGSYIKSPSDLADFIRLLRGP
jgi:RHS repeat-associated protein